MTVAVRILSRAINGKYAVIHIDAIYRAAHLIGPSYMKEIGIYRPAPILHETMILR